MIREIKRYPNLDELNCDAASLISQWSKTCVAERGAFHVVLSGGQSPRKLYGKLSRPPFDVSVPWSHVQLYLGDERFVPATHPDSNYRMVFETLISPFGVPGERVHRPSCDVGSPVEAARLWEQQLKELFPQEAAAGEMPRFDLILLGVGSDGHTASLFPGDPALNETRQWVAAVSEPKGNPQVPRLTLTLPLINRARCVMFLVSGPGKKGVIDDILGAENRSGLRYPAAQVAPEGRLLWLLDGAYV